MNFKIINFFLCSFLIINGFSGSLADSSLGSQHSHDDDHTSQGDLIHICQDLLHKSGIPLPHQGTLLGNLLHKVPVLGRLIPGPVGHKHKDLLDILGHGIHSGSEQTPCRGKSHLGFHLPHFGSILGKVLHKIPIIGRFIPGGHGGHHGLIHHHGSGLISRLFSLIKFITKALLLLAPLGLVALPLLVIPILALPIGIIVIKKVLKGLHGLLGHFHLNLHHGLKKIYHVLHPLHIVKNIILLPVTIVDFILHFRQKIRHLLLHILKLPFVVIGHVVKHLFHIVHRIILKIILLPLRIIKCIILLPLRVIKNIILLPVRIVKAIILLPIRIIGLPIFIIDLIGRLVVHIISIPIKIITFPIKLIHRVVELLLSGSKSCVGCLLKALTLPIRIPMNIVKFIVNILLIPHKIIKHLYF